MPVAHRFAYEPILLSEYIDDLSLFIILNTHRSRIIWRTDDCLIIIYCVLFYMQYAKCPRILHLSFNWLLLFINFVFNTQIFWISFY